MGRNAITLVKRNAGGIDYWDARWYDHAADKRRSKTLGRCDMVSERQARKSIAQLDVEFTDDPRMRSPQTVPALGVWMDLFIDRKTAAGRKHNTIEGYVTLKKLLVAHFGADRQINTITKYDLEMFRVRLAKHELHTALRPKNKRRANAASVTRYMRLVSAVFTAAFDDDLIQRNPARKLGLSQTPSAEWHKVTPEEFWLLMSKAQGGTRTLLALCRLAGLRRSDAMALAWSNVRLDEGVLVFRPIKVERFAKMGARVPICAELKVILEEARQTSLRLDGFVVARDVPVNIYDRFVHLFAAAGVAPWAKPLHTLRKSCIDDWARIAPANVVMEWATHMSLSTTMKYYTKVNRADEAIGQASLLKQPASPAAVATAG